MLFSENLGREQMANIHLHRKSSCVGKWFAPPDVPKWELPVSGTKHIFSVLFENSSISILSLDKNRVSCVCWWFMLHEQQEMFPQEVTLESDYFRQKKKFD